MSRSSWLVISLFATWSISAFEWLEWRISPTRAKLERLGSHSCYQNQSKFSKVDAHTRRRCLWNPGTHLKVRVFLYQFIPCWCHLSPASQPTNRSPLCILRNRRFTVENANSSIWEYSRSIHEYLTERESTSLKNSSPQLDMKVVVENSRVPLDVSCEGNPRTGKSGWITWKANGNRNREKHLNGSTDSVRLELLLRKALTATYRAIVEWEVELVCSVPWILLSFY